MLRQCFSSGTAADSHTPYKARPSENWPKITTYDHVHQIFITSCTWFRRGVLCDRGFTWTNDDSWILVNNGLSIGFLLSPNGMVTLPETMPMWSFSQLAHRNELLPWGIEISYVDPCSTGIILYMRRANERRRYIVTSSLIGWAHLQNDPWFQRL